MEIPKFNLEGMEQNTKNAFNGILKYLQERDNYIKKLNASITDINTSITDINTSIMDMSTYAYNHSNRPTSDQYLSIGQSKIITIDSSTNYWYLDTVVSAAQMYEINFGCSGSVTTTYDDHLEPNNTTTSGVYRTRVYVTPAGAVGGDALTGQTRATIGSHGIRQGNIKIKIESSNSTVNYVSNENSISGMQYQSGINYLTGALSWTSLGRFSFGENFTGYVLIKRIM